MSSLIGSGSTAATVTVQDDGDGLVWVAGALAVDSPLPEADVLIQPQTLLVPRGSTFIAEVSALAHGSAPVAVTGQLEVTDDRGHFLGLFAGPRSGRLQPGDPKVRTLRRKIPSSGLPARLIGVPITVSAKLFRQGTSEVIDDDFCRFVIQ